jgi:hypothetical protein
MALGRRSPRALSPTAAIRRRALDRALYGDDRLWQSVFMMIVLRRLARRVMGAEPKLVASEKLEAGQAIRVESIDKRKPRSRRRGR